jgi:uncharacterized membrane protein
MVINGSQIKANAWESIKNTKPSPMLGTAFVLLLSGVSQSLQTNAIEKDSRGLVILTIVMSLIVSFVTISYQWYCLNVSRNQSPEPLSMFEIFTGDRLWKVFKLWALMSIKIMLWSVLFIVPGIVKAYAYSQSFYVLYDNPDYTASQCIKESERLMKGNKLEYFVFELSFVGWALLSAVLIIVASTILHVFLPDAIATTVSSLVMLPFYTYVNVSNANFYNAIYMEQYNQYQY